MILYKPVHGSREDDAHFHAIAFHNLLKNGAEVICDASHGVERVFPVVRIMGDNTVKEFCEGIFHKCGEIWIEVQMLPYEFCVLRAEAVWKGFGVDDVKELLIAVAQFLSGDLIHGLGHVAADIIRDEAFSKVSSAAFVSKDESA